MYCIFKDFSSPLCRFDRLFGGSGKFRRFDGERHFEFAGTEHFQAAVVLDGFGKPVCHDESVIDHRSFGQFRKVGKVDDDVNLFRVVIEASLGHAAGNRHLAAFKSGTDTAARTRPLTLMAFTGGLAEAGADSATQSLGRPNRSLCGRKSIYSHDQSP